MQPGRRAWALVFLIVWAELALVVFAVVPPAGKVIALFLERPAARHGVGRRVQLPRGPAHVRDPRRRPELRVRRREWRGEVDRLVAARCRRAPTPGCRRSPGLLFLPVFLARGLRPEPDPAAERRPTSRRAPSASRCRGPSAARSCAGSCPASCCWCIVYLFLTVVSRLPRQLRRRDLGRPRRR